MKNNTVLDKARTTILNIEGPLYWDLLGRDSILCAWRGSVAHGTHIPHTNPDTIDDLDLISVVVPGSEYYMGLKEWGSRGTEEIVKFHTDSNNPVIIDCVHYELRKFLSMVANGNPNVLPALWMSPEFYMRKTATGSLLLENKHLFTTKKAWYAWKGYATSQIHKMHKGEIAGHLGAKRREMFKEIGYDCKSASHLIRLLRTSLELLETGVLNVWRQDAEELIAIKTGKWSEHSVMVEATKLLDLCEIAFTNTILPGTPDYDAINRLSVKIAMCHMGMSSCDIWDNEWRDKLAL